jgi:hypothetical protein
VPSFARVALAGLLLVGCTRDTRPPPSDDLSSLTVQLAPGPVRLLTHGSVGSVAADVYFEVGSPVSSATAACFEDGPRVEGQVKTGFPDGRTRTLPELTLRAFEFSGQRYPPMKVALEEGKTCEVVLGLDVLSHWALQLDLAKRQLKFLRPAKRADYEARALVPDAEGWETHLLEVTRDPTGDWPMLAMKVKQADESLVAPFVLSTREAATRVSAEAAHGAGLRIGKELFEGLAVPEGIKLPDSITLTDVVITDALELSPGFGVIGHTLKLDPKWQGKGVAGVLGGDVWGRFDTLIDLQAGVLWLRRPRVLESGPVQRCVVGGVTGEEGCYQLTSRATPEGLEASAVLWRSLPNGGRLYLEVEGEPKPPCRIGFSFGPSDRGASAHFVFPWAQLGESMEACAAALVPAKGASLALFDDTPQTQCPGTCAFAEDLMSRHVTCVCESGGALNEADRTVLRLYKMLLEQELKRRDRANEPKDPE